MRCELERKRVDSLRPRAGLLNWTSDWFLACAGMAGCGSANGDDTRADLDREGMGAGPGEGEREEFRAKGLLRHRGPL